jgi:DNA modification methylase
LLQGDVLDELDSLPRNRFSLIVSSPPYNIGKIYERGKRLSLHDYLRWQSKIAKRLVDCLREGEYSKREMDCGSQDSTPVSNYYKYQWPRRMFAQAGWRKKTKDSSAVHCVAQGVG